MLTNRTYPLKLTLFENTCQNWFDTDSMDVFAKAYRIIDECRKRICYIKVHAINPNNWQSQRAYAKLNQWISPCTATNFVAELSWKMKINSQEIWENIKSVWTRVANVCCLLMHYCENVERYTRTNQGSIPQCKYTKFLNYRMVRHVPRALLLLFKLRQHWRLCIRDFLLLLGLKYVSKASRRSEYVYITSGRHVTNRIHFVGHTICAKRCGYRRIWIRFDIDTNIYELHIWRIGAE